MTVEQLDPAGPAAVETEAEQAARARREWAAADVSPGAVADLLGRVGPSYWVWLAPGVRTAKGRCADCRRVVRINVGTTAAKHDPVSGDQTCEGSGQKVLSRYEVAAGDTVGAAAAAAGEPAAAGAGEQPPAPPAADGGPAPVVLAMVALDELTAHPSNPRRDVGDVTELAESIRVHGLLQPVVVAPAADADGRWVLIAGHRRAKAARWAGLVEVPAVVRPDLDTPGRQLEAMLVENGRRVDLTAIEEAEGYRQLKLFGYRPAQIAAATGRSKATVDRRLALLRLPESARERLHGGQLSIGDAEAMAEFARDGQTLNALARVAGTRDFEFELQRARRRRDNAVKVAAAAAEARAAGVTVLDDPPQGWHAWRQLDESPQGTPYRLSWIPASRIGGSDAAHAETCPHHAVVPDPDGGELVACCLNPASHARGNASTGDDAGLDGLDPQATARAEADRAQAAQLREDLAAAKAARDAFVTDLLAPGYRPPAAAREAMLRHAIAAAARYDDNEDSARAWQLLGLPPLEPAEDGDDPTTHDVIDQLCQLVAGWSVERLVQVVYALLVVPFAPPLDAGRREWDGDGWRISAVEHLDHLQRLGYQPCEVERRILAELAAEAAAGEASADAADGDTAGEEGREGEVAAPVRTCARCGCTDEQACAGGCEWMAGRPTGDQLCSACASTPPAP
ncbi:MAG TPA: ParB/RepB/Spo0J family partition protein [Mycobacteriales bacterium]|nr:ParB/RepB/Spo0J family partition protein [Mycobacteriales bacterium]